MEVTLTMIESQEEEEGKRKVSKIFTWEAPQPERSPPPSSPPSLPSPWKQNVIIDISYNIIPSFPK